MEQVQMDSLCYQLFGMFPVIPDVPIFSIHTAHDLFRHLFHHLPVNMVRRLATRGCYTYRKQT